MNKIIYRYDNKNNRNFKVVYNIIRVFGTFVYEMQRTCLRSPQSEKLVT